MYKNKKVLISFVLCLTLIACLPGMSALAATNNQLQPLDADSIASIVSAFYENKDMYESNEFDVYLTEDLAEYVKNKVDTQWYVMDLYDTQKENYSVEIILLEQNANISRNIVTFKFQVVSRFNYVGCDFDTTVSDEVNVSYDVSERKITDIYAPYNYYDVAMRGEGVSFSGNNFFHMTDNFAEKQESIIDDIDATYIAEMSDVAVDFDPTYETSSTMLNYTAIVNWARNNYYKAQPSSGNGSVPYYDFSEITGNYDCTNFASHALLAGGAKVNDPGGSGITSTGWYYRSLSNRSTAWSLVTKLYDYLTTNTTSNTAAGSSFIYSTNPNFWGLGDVLQLKFSTGADYSHSTIITKRTTSSDGTRAYAYVTGRTSDSQNNNNQAAADMAPNGSKRVITVFNR